MKKTISLVIALVICISLACPAFAADDFVPSISYKGAPELVPVQNENGGWVYGIIRDSQGNVLEYVEGNCLLITPVAEAEKSTLIPQDAKETLLYVYEKLTDGSMTLPYSEKHMSDTMVIKELFDISWICEPEHIKGHEDYLLPEGNVLELVFRIRGISDFTSIVTMTYKQDKWGEIAKVENLGNDLVRFTFEHLCPVAVSVDEHYADALPQTGDMAGQQLTLWSSLMVAAAFAMVALVFVRRKKI